MTVLERRPALRWLVPTFLALLLAGGGAVVGGITAAARGGLPARSAAQLLVDVQQARLTGLSGTVVQTANLGIPALPDSGPASSSGLTSLVSGSHTLRVWYAGPNRVRLALLGSLGESDVVRTGADLWTWSSADKSATHRTVPLASQKSSAGHTDIGSSMTPQQIADQALGAITPTTKVSTDGTAQVAGRSAYELVLQPRTSATLVDSVHISIDGATHIPLRVQVYARGGNKPALEVGFTSFDPTAPAASVFTFNPPPGTKVTQESGMPADKAGTPGAPGEKGTAPEAKPTGPTTSGTGWSSVVVTKLPTGTVDKTNPLAGMIGKLPVVNGAWGSGHLLRGTLFSAVLTDDGRLAVGAVAPEALYAALAG